MESILNLYYEFKLAQDGIKFCGKQGKIVYGKDREGNWYFYIAYDFVLVFVKKCEDKLSAKFLYSVLLNKKA